MRFRYLIVAFDCLQSCGLRFAEGVCWQRETIFSLNQIIISQSRIRQSVFWIDADCLVEIVSRFVESVFGSLVPVVPPFQVKLIGFRALGGWFNETLLLISRQTYF